MWCFFKICVLASIYRRGHRFDRCDHATLDHRLRLTILDRCPSAAATTVLIPGDMHGNDARSFDGATMALLESEEPREVSLNSAYLAHNLHWNHLGSAAFPSLIKNAPALYGAPFD
jgi:hypothetical protein